MFIILCLSAGYNKISVYHVHVLAAVSYTCMFQYTRRLFIVVISGTNVAYRQLTNCVTGESRNVLSLSLYMYIMMRRIFSLRKRC